MNNLKTRGEIVLLEILSALYKMDYKLKEFINKGEDNMSKFTKKYLKDGMVVRTRDGMHEFYMVLGGRLIGHYYFEDIISYNENLLTEDDPNEDIVEVYESNCNSLGAIFEEDQLISIWKREEYK